MGNPVQSDYLLFMMTEILAQSLRDRPGRSDARGAGAREAAVAVVIRPDGCVLFIRRAVHERDPWSGHIALPGGRVDPIDRSAEAAARRETLEEVGVDLSAARCLGMLDQVVSPDMTPRVVVSPYVFVIDETPAVHLDRTEVADFFWFSLERMLKGEGRGTFEFDYQGASVILPRVDLDGARIWGMTLRIVDDLLTHIRRKG